MDSLNCNRCGARRDTSDNFCRQCGHELTINLPMVRSERLPAAVRPTGIPPQLIGSVAILALGTGLEWLGRRLAGQMARAAGRAIVGSDRAPISKRETPRSVEVDEVLYVRKVQLRR